MASSNHQYSGEGPSSFVVRPYPPERLIEDRFLLSRAADSTVSGQAMRVNINCACAPRSSPLSSQSPATSSFWSTTSNKSLEVFHTGDSTAFPPQVSLDQMDPDGGVGC